MSKQQKYRVITGCAKDNKKDGTTQRFGAGDILPAGVFSDKDIKWLLEKGAIEAVESDDKSR